MDTRKGTRYRSKRVPGVYAEMNRKQKDGKYLLRYLNGDKFGEYFVASESTLNRWWRVANDYVNPDVLTVGGVEILKTVLEKPYISSSVKEYKVRPKSADEYENKALPSYEKLKQMFVKRNIAYKKLNRSYIILEDETTIHRYANDIRIFTNERFKAIFENVGILVIDNIVYDEKRPYMAKINTKSELDLVMGVFSKCMKRS